MFLDRSKSSVDKTDTATSAVTTVQSTSLTNPQETNPVCTEETTINRSKSSKTAKTSSAMFSKSPYQILARLMVSQANNTGNKPPTIGVAEMPVDKIDFTMKKLKTKMNKITKQSSKTIGMLTGGLQKRMKTPARELIGLGNWISKKVPEVGVLMHQTVEAGETEIKLIEVVYGVHLQWIWINQI